MDSSTVDIAWEECIPDLPLDSASLPPLNALSSSSSSDLQHLELLDLFQLDSPVSPILSSPPQTPTKPKQAPPKAPFSPLNTLTEKLSTCTSTPSHSSTLSNPPSPEAVSPHQSSSTSLHPRPHVASSPRHPAPDLAQKELVNELSTRLSAASNESTALRKRVAALTAENRGLRAALDHANARLVAVAHAAAVHPPPQSPVMLGLAQVSADVAQRLAGALSISDTTDDPRDRKKRKRVTGAATTMACVMFMWGAMVGTPGLLKSGSSGYRSDANLPAIWTSKETGTAVAPAMPRVVDPKQSRWQPNCMRVLKQLPNGKEKKEDDMELDTDSPQEVKKEDKTIKEEDVVVHDSPDHGDAMFVDLKDEEAANVVARSDMRSHQIPDYSYVLCRDAGAAIDNVKACASRMQRGEKCGQPHTISLILPAAAAGVDDGTETTEDGMPALAEVQCSITSVARIPVTASVNKSKSKYGRVIATVAEGKGDGRQGK